VLKSGLRREIPVPKALFAHLERLAADQGAVERGKVPVLFRPSSEGEYGGIGIYSRHHWRDHVWEPAMETTGLDYTTRDLRSFCASMLVDSGATLLEAKKVLGHQRADTTERYYTRSLDMKKTDRARASIRLTASLSYQERMDRLFNAWVKKFGNPLRLR
jgi:integrase